MKTIIALYRRANTGKSTTLNYLIGLLKEQEVDFKEKREIVYYGSKKIAVTTPGDNAHEIKRNIEFFKKRRLRYSCYSNKVKGRNNKHYIQIS